MKPSTLFTILAFLCGQLQARPLKVFILAGQSNMEGHAKIESTIKMMQQEASK